MTNISSHKREYQIFLSEKLFEKTNRHIKGLSPTQLQEYIDYCFSKASKLGSSTNGGAWAESRIWRDKGKMGIIEKENR